MKQPKLVILRGRPTSGKSTALANLRKKKEMKNWVIFDFSKHKGNFDNFGKEGKEFAKITLAAILKSLLKTKKNIIFDEMSRKSIMRYVGKEIKKYNYKIIVFQFTVRTETAYKRDVQRSKEKWHPFMGKNLVDKLHKYHDENIDPEGIIVDTNKLGKKQAVDFILKELKLNNKT